MMISIKKRFDLQTGANGIRFAPMSIGSPNMVIEPIDPNIIKQSKKDKEKAWTAKKEFKAKYGKNPKMKTWLKASF